MSSATTLNNIKFFVLLIISYSLPVFGGSIGLIMGFIVSGTYVTSNIYPINNSRYLGELVIMLFLDSTFNFMELLFIGVPCAFIGMIVGIISGSYAKVRFDAKFR